MTNKICRACNESADGSDTIACCSCGGLYHSLCIQYTNDSRPSKRRWRCPGCLSKTVNADNTPVRGLIPSTSSDTKQNNGELLDEIRREIREQIKDVFHSELGAFRREMSLNNDKLVKIIESQSALINEKLKVIDAIKEENDELRKRVSLLETRCDPLVLADEMEDRISRSKNVIICGLDESPSIADDGKKVAALLNVLDPEITPDRIGCIRLGRGGGDKPRPLKVSLGSAERALLVVRGRRRLVGDLRIYPDRTPMQREQMAELHRQLSERKAKGETDLYIKYSRGRPGIACAKFSKN